MEGYVDPETGRVIMRDDSITELFKSFEEMAALSRQMRLEAGRQAMDDLAHGVDPFNVARMLTEISSLCDTLDVLPDQIHKAIQILPDPEPERPPKPGRYLGRTADPAA